MSRLLLLIITVFTILSCKHSASLTEAEKKDIIENVSRTLASYYTDIRKSGLYAEFKYLDNSPDFFWVPPGYSNAITYDSVAAILKHAAPEYKSVDNRIDSLQIKPLSKVLATYTGQVTSTITDTAGKLLRITLVETGVIVKRQDGWKLLCGQTSIVNH